MTAGYFDTGSPVFYQERVGFRKRKFRIIKFRSMRLSTKSLPTHLVDDSALTKWGYFIRRFKLDELPQLLNVLFGDMSFVGPRPCLPSQVELIHEREIRGVYCLRPGITGLAQIKKIDMSNPKILAIVDAKMVSKLNISHYFNYILLTFLGRGFGDRVIQREKVDSTFNN
jgi:lipopolysaccharide/colanic/teichoic acid biosynthesis glycosyltransferase